MNQESQSTGQTQNAPTKKAWYKRWWVILIGVFLVLGIIGSGGEKSENADTKEKTTSQESQEETRHKIGETLSLGDIEASVISFKESSSVGSDFFKSNPAEGGVYVTVQWKYKNVSTEPIKAFSNPSIKLVDQNGTEYSADISASSNFATELKLDRKIVSDLNPGITVNDASVFEVSKELFSKETWYLILSYEGKKYQISLQ